MPKIQIRKFRGLKDYYFSWGMQPVRGGNALAVIGRMTNAAIEGTLANMTTPVAIDYERTGSKAYMLCDNTYLFYSANGISGWTLATNFSTVAGYDNNMITDQNDSLLIMHDDYIGVLKGAKDWTANWTPTVYTFTNGTTGVYHPAARVREFVIFGDDNIIARYDSSAGTYVAGDFTASALTLPPGYVTVALAEKGKTSRKCYIAANFNKKGYIMEWDTTSANVTSTTPVGEEVRALVTAENDRTYAIIGNGILYDISAYPIVPVFTPPDNEAQLTISDLRSFTANALSTSRRKIYMGYSGGSSQNRHKAGLWVYDIDSQVGQPLCPISSGDQRVASIKAIKPVEVGIQYRILIGSQDASGVGRMDYFNDNSLVNGAFYISPIVSAPKSILRGIKFNLTQLLYGGEENDLSAVIYASYFNFEKSLWRRGIEDTISPTSSKIEIDNGAAVKPSLGDEITILEKANAGYTRRVIAEDLGSDPNIFTLDSAMSAVVEDAVQMNVQSFKKLNTTATTVTKGGEVWIECPDRPEFRNLLIKIEIRLASGSIPVLSDLDIIYDRLPDRK